MASASTGAVEVVDVISDSLAYRTRKEIVSGKYRSGGVIDETALSLKRTQYAAWEAARAPGKRTTASKWNLQLSVAIRADGNATRALVASEAAETRAALAPIAEDARVARVTAAAAHDLLMGKEVPLAPGDTDKQLIDRLQLQNRNNHTAIRNARERHKLRMRGLLVETPAARASREAREQEAATKAESAQKVKDEKKAAKDLAAAKKKTEAADKKAASSSTAPKAKPRAKAKAKAKAKATDTGDQTALAVSVGDGAAEGNQTTLAVSVGDGAVESTEINIDEETDPEVLRGLIHDCEDEKVELKKVIVSDATPKEKLDATLLYGEEVRISALLYKRLQVIAGAGQGQEQEPGQDGQEQEPVQDEQAPGDEQGDSEPSSKRQCTGGVQQGVELAQDETAKGAQEAKGAESSSLSALRRRYPGAMEERVQDGEHDWLLGFQGLRR
jgi:hypothetical protein